MVQRLHRFDSLGASLANLAPERPEEILQESFHIRFLQLLPKNQCLPILDRPKSSTRFDFFLHVLAKERGSHYLSEAVSRWKQERSSPQQKNFFLSWMREFAHLKQTSRSSIRSKQLRIQLSLSTSVTECDKKWCVSPGSGASSCSFRARSLRRHVTRRNSAFEMCPTKSSHRTPSLERLAHAPLINRGSPLMASLLQACVRRCPQLERGHFLKYKDQSDNAPAVPTNAMPSNGNPKSDPATRRENKPPAARIPARLKSFPAG